MALDKRGAGIDVAVETDRAAADSSTQGGCCSAVLVGGPAWFPEGCRRRTVSVKTTALVVQNGNRNEHFVLAADMRGDGERVFTWEYCTRVAE